jgi:hypothetical protein
MIITGYRPKYFILQELVPPRLFEQVRHQTLWGLLDARMLWTMDALRKIYGTLVCNTWNWGGHITLRGLRPFDTSTGAAHSDHKYGRAVDLVPVHTTAEAIRADILADERSGGKNPAYQWITVVETDIPWLHLGFRNRDRASAGIQWVAP